MVIVRFTRQYDSYNSGETAGFPAVKAEELVALGVAKLDAPPEIVPVTAETPSMVESRRKSRGR